MTVPRPEREVKSFFSEEDVADDLAASLSPERLSTYLRAARGDRERALRLYTWNTAMSAAFYGPLQGLEVALRNAVHRQLGGCYGADWYDNPAAGLNAGCLERIQRAKADVDRAGASIDPPRVVAELSFGFWISLLGSGGRTDPTGRKADYERTLWRPALRGAFAFCETLTRKQAHGPLNDLRTLRNRIAHHEPIFARRLEEDYESILEVTGWISPGTRAWIERCSRVSMLLPLRDAAEIRF